MSPAPKSGDGLAGPDHGLALAGRLPTIPFLHDWMETSTRDYLRPIGAPPIDFAHPPGEAALFAPGSLTWRVFKNPIVLFIGGLAAVIIELAEPAVRTGVWEHSTFRSDPVGRLRRTGLATMVSVYGPRSVAEAMIARVVQMHDGVTGTTPMGRAYHANDAELLTWVYATAGFGFARAYSRYVAPLNVEAMDALLEEGSPAAYLYGASTVPHSQTGLQLLFESMKERLEPSPLIFEFIEIMREAPAFPAALRPLQRMFVRAAVEIAPTWLRRRLGLTEAYGLRLWELPLVRQAAGLADKIVLRSNPAVQACVRVGLPADYLYRRTPH